MLNYFNSEAHKAGFFDLSSPCAILRQAINNIEWDAANDSLTDTLDHALNYIEGNTMNPKNTTDRQNERETALQPLDRVTCVEYVGAIGMVYAVTDKGITVKFEYPQSSKLPYGLINTAFFPIAEASLLVKL